MKQDPPASTESLPGSGMLRGTWTERLAFVADMMRELSSETDPQQMQEKYVARMRKIVKVDGFVSLSRRNLQRPQVRITRSHLWGFKVNPWIAREHTILDGGLFSDLIWNEQATIIDDFVVDLADPSAPFLDGVRSLVALPLFDQGHALNMVVQFRNVTNGFSREDLPERLWMSNLFGRATQSLVLSEEVKKAYQLVDREMEVVADMQRSLLPRNLPKIPGIELAAHYQTSRRAGGDYYDFFELPDGRLGILIADVSGHGTPAAVMMAVTHSIAHTHGGEPSPPSRLLQFINTHLTARYTTDNGSFVTAFYGIFDPKSRELKYSCAGHCPPRVKRGGDGGRIIALDEALALPLGIDPDEQYFDVTTSLCPGDALVLYTDGITEARRPPSSDLFGLHRLDQVLASCTCDAEMIVRRTLLAVEEFTDSAAPSDDMTLLVAKLCG